MVAMNIGSEVYALFGQPIVRSVRMSSGVYRLTGISANGTTFTESVGIEANDHPSIPGFSVGTRGEQYLLSDTGLLITGTTNVGSASSSLILQRRE